MIGPAGGTITDGDDLPAAVVADTATDDGAAAPAGSAGPRWFHRPFVLIGGLVLVVGVIPAAAALANLSDPQWYPAMDQALVELQVRDVGEGHPPLVGLAGRIYGLEQEGSHPGPLMFWSLFPVYWLLGSSAFALQAATASFNVLGMLVSIWIGYRRGGRALALGVALTLVLLARSYGAEKLTIVWNPYIQVMWWVVFVLAVWSVLCEDFVHLPVAVFAGSFCVQAHYPYLGVVGLVGGLAAVGVVVAVARRRGGPEPRWRPLVRWVLPSVVLLGLLWAAPVIEQLTTEPGNLSVLRDSIQHPVTDRFVTQEPGLGHTAEIWIAHLNIGTLLTHTRDSITAAPETPLLPGLVLLGAWVAAVTFTWRRRRRSQDRELLLLHVAVAAALVAGFVSVHSIPNDTWDYLVLWAWGTTSLLVLATLMTAVRWWASTSAVADVTEESTSAVADVAEESTSAVADVAEESTRGPVPWRPAVGVLAVAVATVALASTYEATQARIVLASAQSEMVAELAPPTVAALRAGDVPGGGDGRYLVLWDEDARWSGMTGTGFLLELDRGGIDAGGTATLADVVGDEHRVVDPAEADGVIHLVIGPEHIERWEATPGAVHVASFEPRSDEEIREYERLEREVKATFVAEGRPELATLLDSTLAITALADPPAEARAPLERMVELGLPGAVFVAPVGVRPPG